MSGFYPYMNRRQIHIEQLYGKELERARKFIDNSNWINAKSYAHTAPHEYCVISKLSPELHNDFYFFCAFIKQAGIIEYFYNTPYVYLRIGDWKYWTMEKPGETPILINRALAKNKYDLHPGKTQVSE